LVVAVAAIAVAAWTALWARRQARRSLYLDLEARLTDLDSQEGRRLLHSKVANDSAPARLLAREPQQFDKINRVMSLFNTLGSYADRRYIEPEIVTRHWAQNMRNSWPNIERWIRFRQSSSQVGDAAKVVDLVRLGLLCGANVSLDLREGVADETTIGRQQRRSGRPTGL
jgi:hypothetical protein